MKRFLIIMLAAILPMSLWAQHFGNKAKLNAINNTAFYKIKINADVVGYSNDQLQDLRLFDNEGKEVPYLLNKEHFGGQTTSFTSYSFSLSTEGNKGIVIIENPNKDAVEQFLFVMKNADASRLVRISGSDNNENWFVVRDSFYFESAGNDSSPMVEKVLHFPKTDYAFYKVAFANGKDEAPLNIIKIGKNNSQSVAAMFQPVTGFDYKIVDSGKTSFIHVKMKPGNKIDKLHFTIDAPEMYKRSVLITKWMPLRYSDDYRTSSVSRSAHNVQATSINAELLSGGNNDIDCIDFLGTEKCDSFLVAIFNQDDAPLHIKSIEAFKLGTTLTAKLEKGKTYFLYFGDSLLTAPTYDLVYFEKNIPANIAFVDVQPAQPKDKKDKDEYDGKNDKWIVWTGLSIAGVTILLLTINMMRKMNHSES